jgi:hypothetical protein
MCTANEQKDKKFLYNDLKPIMNLTLTLNVFVAPVLVLAFCYRRGLI